VFYTSLGVPDDFQLEPFRKMLAQAVFWAANRPVEKNSPAAAN
jgi:type 1 glutamine amidotransferase